jgi:ankyrin repeat protein
MKYLEKEHNWDIHIKNNYGHDAYYFAKSFKHNEIIKHLDKKFLQKDK